jgi:hypothetical protein
MPDGVMRSVMSTRDPEERSDAERHEQRAKQE